MCNMKHWAKASIIVSAMLQAAVLHADQPIDVSDKSSVTRFVNGLWFDGQTFRPREMFSVDGRFQSATNRKVARTVDLDHMFIIPPFADAHNHPIGSSDGLTQRIDQLVDSGILYLQDPNGVGELVKAVRKTLLNEPAIEVRFATCGITSPDGHPSGLYEHLSRANQLPGLNGAALDGQAYLTVDSLEQLEKKWPQFLSHRPDAVKIFLECSGDSGFCESDPQLRGRLGIDPDLVPAIVERSAAAGLGVIAHVITSADFRCAVRAGVKQVAHLPREMLTAADAEEAKARGVVVVTTTLGHGNPSRNDTIDRYNLRLLHDAGVQLAIGTDNHSQTAIDEILNLHRLDVMTNKDLLTVATWKTSTAIFPDRKLGKLKEGFDASFLALRGNPLASLSKIREVELRFKSGRFVGDTSKVSQVSQSNRSRNPAHENHKTLNPSSDSRFRSWSLASEDAARGQFNDGQWEAAEKSYAVAVEINPYVAAYWQNLAHALHQLGEFDRAIAAWQHALDLGYLPSVTMYNLACAHARNGQTEQAFFWLQESLSSGFDDDSLLREDTDFDQLRDDERFAAIVGACPSDSNDRVMAWRHDLGQLQRRMEMQHYSLYANIQKREFEENITALGIRIPELSDSAAAILLQGILAKIGDAHTNVDLFAGVAAKHAAPNQSGSAASLRFKTYAVDYYLFTDGLFIRGTADSLAELRGARVLTIGGVSAQEAIDRVGSLCSVDNEMGRRFQSALFLGIPEMLQAVGIATESKSLKLEVQLPDGTNKLVAITAGSHASHSDLYRRLAGAGNPKASNPLPLYLKHPNRFFWHEYLPENKIIYSQINVIQNERHTSFAEYAEQLMAAIAEENAERLVIDLRHNGGGDNTLFRPFLHALMRNGKINRRGHLFVIVGRRTLSAAMNLASQIKRHTEAILVGEPTGSCPNFVGETAIITLPCTGVRVSCSSRYHQDSSSTDKRTWMAPRLLAELSSADYFANRDPAMDAISAFIRE